MAREQGGEGKAWAFYVAGRPAEGNRRQQEDKTPDPAETGKNLMNGEGEWQRREKEVASPRRPEAQPLALGQKCVTRNRGMEKVYNVGGIQQGCDRGIAQYCGAAEWAKEQASQWN